MEKAKLSPFLFLLIYKEKKRAFLKKPTERFPKTDGSREEMQRRDKRQSKIAT